MAGAAPPLIYWLPPYGALLSQGVGQTLSRFDVDVAGRETRGAFHALSFDQQVAIVKKDLLKYAWRRDGCVIAQAYGAYLFLHAQAQLLAFPGRLLMISPMMGCLPHEAESQSFRLPPYPSEIMRRATVRDLAFGPHCTWLVGEYDKIAPVQHVQLFAKQYQQTPQIVPGAGAHLDINWLDWRVEQWLKENGVQSAPTA